MTHIVRRRNRYAVLLWMPAHVKNLLVKVNLVRIGLLPHSLRSAGRTVGSAALLAVLTSAWTRGIVHWRGYADLLRLERTLVRLQHDFSVLAFFAWVDHEVVVVAAGHDILRIAGEDDLEFVEDTVVLVCIAQSWSEVLVNIYCLHWLPFHVHVPDLDSEVVTREDVAAIVREADVRDGGDDFGKERSGLWVFLLLEFCACVSWMLDQLLELRYSRFACSSHNAFCLMSASLIVPLLDAYMNTLQLFG